MACASSGPAAQRQTGRWSCGTAIRPLAPASLEQAHAAVTRFVQHYNRVRLHSAIGYITPTGFLAGGQQTIWAGRDRKLEAAREARRVRRATGRGEVTQPVLQ